MSLFRFEHKDKPIAGTATFAGRLLGNFVAALVIVAVALGAGMAGYRLTEGMDWLDAFLNAAMILGGMGPVDTLHTEAGKAFAGGYALFCGLLIVILTGVVLAPILHRVLHALHVKDTAGDL
jgi:hypothetical protein